MRFLGRALFAAWLSTFKQLPRTENFAQDEDVLASVLSREQEQEMEAAAKFVDDCERKACSREEGPGEDSCASSLPGSPSSSRMTASSSFFQKELGIMDLAIVGRKGSRCFHCDNALEKNSLRFVYAHKTSKPPRSLHTYCLAQVPPAMIPTSIRKLQLIMGRDCSDLERQVCSETLTTLQGMQTK